jgi:predicted ATPase/DNA-binding SARP family transcriptional activator
MLGPLEVHTGDGPGQTVQVRGAKLRALLIMLALRPGQLVPSSQLIDGLWADQAPAGAVNALQALVSRLRRALPEAVIESRPAGYQLTLDPRATDVVQFEELAAAGRAQLRKDPAAAAITLRQALGLWRGPALAEVAETDFGRAAIARLDELRLATLENRTDADLRAGTAAPLVSELEGLVVAHPLREPLVGLLMRALRASGRRGAALEAYEQARQRLVAQLGVPPSAELAALHLEILRADDLPAESSANPPAGSAAVPARHPASSGDDRPNTNLRAELTSFVGRDAELAQVAELLGTHRLITLTGPGGAGKTRLAVEAARAEVGAMPDGVWLVELAPVTDPAEVTSAVLAALGLREARLYAGRPAASFPSREAPADEQADALRRLLAALTRQRALLVLDNCEHLVTAAAALADRVLAACPHVRILATSREPLNITGEALSTVGPLTLPPDPAATSFHPERAGVAPAGQAGGVATVASHGELARISECASVRLLTQRVRAVSADFEVTEGNAAAVARICRALDGMPLAIELAAVRLRAMTPEQVAARLDDRFQLLTGGSRTATPRHQTLRAVVDWSWELLDDAERALWRRFSVFTGGATLEAVEQVCAGPAVSPGQVLDLLTALTDKSLLTVRHGPGGAGEPRYRMLEIIKAYGRERLAEAGESDELRQAHARYFLDLADRSQQYLRGGQQLDWLTILSGDQDNLHAAIRGAAAAGDADTAVHLAGSLGWYWWLRSMKAEGAELIAEALAVPREAAYEDGRDDDDVERLAVAYTLGALLATDSIRSDSAGDWFRIATELAGRIPVPHNPLLRLVGPLGKMFAAVVEAGKPAPPDAFDEVVDAADPWVRATARIVRGHLALNFGRLHAQAEADFVQATDIFGALGERSGLAVALGGLAMLEAWRGEHAAAADHYRQATELTAELGSTEDETQFRLWLARELWLLGRPDQARTELTRAQRDAMRLGLSEVVALAAYIAGDLARLDGEPDVARAELLRAVQLASSVTAAQQIRVLAATGLGYLAAAAGDLDAARGWHAQALAAARSSADAPVMAQALVGLADLALREADPERAAELLGAGLTIRGTTDRSVQEEERVAADARAVLGDTRFAEAYQRGRDGGLGGWVSPKGGPGGWVSPEKRTGGSRGGEGFVPPG